MGKTNSLTRLNVGGAGGFAVRPIIQVTNTSQANINQAAPTAIAFNAVAIQNTSPATFMPGVTGITCLVTGLYLCSLNLPAENNSGILGPLSAFRINWVIAGVTQAAPQNWWHIPNADDETGHLDGILSVTAGQIVGAISTRTGPTGLAFTTAAEAAFIIQRVT